MATGSDATKPPASVQSHLFVNSFIPSTKKGIFILSAARSTSTTLMKIFQQLIDQNMLPPPPADHPSPDPSAPSDNLATSSSFSSSPSLPSLPHGLVFLEPFSQPYYLEHNLTATPGFTFQETLPTTFPEALNNLITQTTNPHNTFILVKDLGHQCQHLLEPAYTHQLDLLLENYHFLFLVRSPAETILSGYHQYYVEGQGDLYQASDVGMTHLKHIFDLVESKLGSAPYVLEANDYLEDPENILSSYFHALGFPFQKEFLSWSPMSDDEVTRNADFRLWGDAWYGVLRKSSGLQKKEKKKQKNIDSSHGDDDGKKSQYPYSLDLSPLKEILESELPAYLEIRSRGAIP
jgi:hypothetical protein